MRKLLLLLLPVLISSCAWVELSASGQAIKVSYDKNLDACEKKGEIVVSVRDQVLLVKRNPTKVRDELESLARNQAAALGADTIQAQDQPHGGEQTFGAYRCR